MLSEIDWTYPIHGLGWEPTDQLAGGVKQKKCGETWEVYRELQKEKENQTGTRKLTRNEKVKLLEYRP